ncbi:uncharacterized protein LOC129581090 [Paramacrobiotus metropolitanus]|uniref:uncharacterized protein LOC129581090 n=1 Tax=Paramacrobiotus metropolitanus TaxID=2943436 RepID=UPI002445B78D|nr:uncharacterized protein LOC129581090 [Paramacrobiotus metropolitanus]
MFHTMDIISVIVLGLAAIILPGESGPANRQMPIPTSTGKPHVVNVTECHPAVLPPITNPGFCSNLLDLDAFCMFLEVAEAPECSVFIGNYCCYQSLPQGNNLTSSASKEFARSIRVQRLRQLQQRSAPIQAASPLHR